MFNIPLISILVFPLLVLGPLFPALPISTSITMRLAIGIVIFSIVLAWYSRRAEAEKILVYILFFALLICIVPIVIKEYDSFILAIILSGLLGFVAFRYFKLSMPLLGVFVFLCLYLVLYYLRNGNLEEALYTAISGETVGASRNFVGVVLLQYYLIYYAVCITNRIKPHHWPMFVMPMIAIMSAGVSSTVVAIALMFGYLVVNLRLRLKHGVLGLVFIALVGLVASRWVESTLLFERLTSGQFVMSRALLWTDFFDKLDTHSIVVGFPKEASFIDHEVSLKEVENLHNSYLNLYKKVGIFSCLYFGLIGYVAFALFGINKILFMIYFASLIRAATDGYYFTSFLVDFIIFYLFMLTSLGKKLSISVKRLRQETRKQEYVRAVQ
ncbi:MAG: hypothetical protein Q8K18_09830 [Burkholderiales bacterium]|nr:hypothetical protein [Burkholderiales bacterium]